MTYRIYFTLADGTEDSVLISGETVEDIREQAERELEQRGGIDPWSEPA